MDHYYFNTNIDVHLYFCESLFFITYSIIFYRFIVYCLLIIIVINKK